MDIGDFGVFAFCMLKTSGRDPVVEFVAAQMKRVNWICGFTFVENQGYRLDWSPQGQQRMLLLQIALRDNRKGMLGTNGTVLRDRREFAAITDFWEACVAQLFLEGNEDSVAAFVRVIDCWQPRTPQI